MTTTQSIRLELIMGRKILRGEIELSMFYPDCRLTALQYSLPGDSETVVPISCL